MYGIFNECTFINEKGAFKSKREIKHSEKYKEMLELIKKYKKEKDPETKEELRKQSLIVVNDMIFRVKAMPDDSFGERLLRNAIVQFTDPFRFILNLFNIVSIDFSTCPTRNDFLNELYSIQEKLRRVPKKK